ncbi:extracellular calcium-sensing receptor-like isoform X2 [Clavelina lepadiformis]|uniref:extracellular calcium-sensing receptor-like isoform X2 n=1 Tax=Clavelina lepadiformis TaxID=159417 RepID=UPI0040432837
MRWLNFSVLILTLLLVTSHTEGIWTRSASYSQPGDVIIGGLFPLHYESKRPDNYSLLTEPATRKCVRYNYLGFRWFQAMIFAIEEVNNRTDLLPDIKLGWDMFDTCNTNAIAVRESLQLMENRTKPLNSSISAVIGPTASDKATVTSNIFSVYDVPQISYAATSILLSEKEIYSSFFRTIPSDNEQVQAVVDLLVRNDWSWIGAIAGDDDYGRPAIIELKSQLEKLPNQRICLEFVRYIRKSTEPSEMREIAKEIRDFNATVFVVFAGAPALKPLANEMKLLRVNKTWIATEAWATSDTIRSVSADLWKGTLGVAARGGTISGFRDFLERVSPQSQPHNPFIRDFWEAVFSCNCPMCGEDLDQTSHFDLPICDGMEDLTSSDAQPTYLAWPGNELEKSYNVYLAVYVIAHSLHNITTCVDGEGLFEGGKCPQLETLQPWQLMAYMKKVHFYPRGQNLQFYFDENNDPNASYKLVSWTPTGPDLDTIEFIQVGNYSSMTDPHWSIDESNIYWRNDDPDEVPLSVCSKPCPPGSYRIRLSSDCCYECRVCGREQYSVKWDSAACLSCNLTQRSNDNRTGCIPKIAEYVRWNDAYGISFCVFAGIGLLLTLFTAGLFVRKRHTPVVKATNWELSSVLLLSIAVCFLACYFYIGEPKNWNCKARMVSFGLSFTFAIASILVKTLRVLTAFEAKMPIAIRGRSKWFGEHMQILLVLIIFTIQVILCVTWLVVDPPSVAEPRDDNMTYSDYYVIECNMGSLPLLGCVYIYIVLLALAAFIFAFRSRKLPDNFNEAKFITFSMLIFFIVWISFIPAYLTTEGSTTTAVNCIAILASTYGILGCIFFPKVYVILITPERNTTEEMRLNTVTHAMRAVQSLSRSVHRTKRNSEGASLRYRSSSTEEKRYSIQDVSTIKDMEDSIAKRRSSGITNISNNNNNIKHTKNKSPAVKRIEKRAVLKKVYEEVRSSTTSSESSKSSSTLNEQKNENGIQVELNKSFSSTLTTASDNCQPGAKINVNVNVNVEIQSDEGDGTKPIYTLALPRNIDGDKLKIDLPETNLSEKISSIDVDNRMSTKNSNFMALEILSADHEKDVY